VCGNERNRRIIATTAPASRPVRLHDVVSQFRSDVAPHTFHMRSRSNRSRSANTVANNRSRHSNFSMIACSYGAGSSALIASSKAVSPMPILYKCSPRRATRKPHKTWAICRIPFDSTERNSSKSQLLEDTSLRLPRLASAPCCLSGGLAHDDWTE
jgi:hypothetical protein